MALPATMVGEIRSLATNANQGGWFDGAQGTPLLSPTDLVCAKGGTTVTSATGGFTAAMVGHALVVTGGTNFRLGQCTILTRADTNTITVDISPCPNAAGTGGTATVSEGVDYTQQVGPQVTYVSAANNLLAAGAGNDVTGEGTAFTADHVGNSILVTGGTNLTVGRYIIASVAAGVATVVGAAAIATGASTDGVGYLGGANTLTDAFLETAVPGVTIYLKADGTHLPAAISMAADGTAALPWNLIGYYTARGDSPTGTDRPLINSGANGFVLAGQYAIIRHLRYTSTEANGFRPFETFVLENCSFANTSTTPGRSALLIGGTYGSLLNCTFTSPYGIGISSANLRGILISRCVIRDCGQKAILATTDGYWRVNDSVFDTCGVGIEVSTASGWCINRCNFYNCIQGIAPTGAAYAWIIENCNFAFNGDGAKWEDGTNQLINWWDYNNWYSNTVDVTNVTKGANDTAYDPAFPQHTSLTDLACASGAPLNVTSATGFNGRWAAGDLIRIRGAVVNHWFAADAVYVVTAVVDANTLTLNTTPGDGTTTDAGGSAYVNRSTSNVQDFTLGAASSCRGAGVGLGLGVATASTVEQGAWMAGAGAGGGGLLMHPGMAGGAHA